MSSSKQDGSWKNVKLSEKTVIITGANTGIGLCTAVDLARREARVIIACRNAEKAETARKKVLEEAKCPEDKVVVKSLDLASFDSIRKFAEDINASEERLNILINNAGVMMCPEGKTADGFEMQFGVNHLGHFLLSHLLMDLLKKSAPSRIVVVSSAAINHGSVNFDDLNSTKSYDPWTAYCQSKIANVLYSRYLSKQLEGSGVTVNSLHPGAVKTDLQRYEDEPGSWMWKTILKLHRFFTTWKTPEEGAETSIYCAVAPELDGVTGKYFGDCKMEDESKAAKNDADAERLWNISLEMTKLKE